MDHEPTNELESVYPTSQRLEAEEWLNEIIESLIEVEHNRMTVPEWAEAKRVLPEGLTSMPGPFRFEVAPYLREIAWCLSVTSSVQKVAMMKGTQLGFTVGVLENAIGYIIDVAPGPSMFVSGDASMAEASIELRVDRMIQSAGLADRIFSQSEKRHNKKTGDTKRRKDFPGGFLLAVGPYSGSKLRSFSIRWLLFDEVDAYPQETRNEGDPIALAEKRTDAFESIRKILYGSTPLVQQSSRIEPLFEAGDQRYYHVPCKHCGAMQAMSWAQIRYERDDLGRLVWDSVHYECVECGGHWFNHDKAWFLERGEWRATAEATEPNYRSYHLNALYSPVGMKSWGACVQEWINAQGDPQKLRVFVNTVLGETWVEKGEAPQYERVMLRRERYAPGEIPETAEAYFVTIGGDVQGDRIECEVVAWGREKESWSLGYHVIEGDTADLQSAAWRGFYEVATAEHAGLATAVVLIDAGYRTQTVYQWVDQFQGGVLAVQGQSGGRPGRRLYKIVDVPEYQIERVDLFVDPLKSELYDYLRNMHDPDEDGRFPRGYCHFPEEYGEAFFQGITAEELVKEKARTGHVRMRWMKKRERNEPLDCRVYAMGGLYIHAQAVSEEMLGLEQIDWKAFWDWWENNAR
ncbi:MAG: phage terminase large subunit family protein [Spirochaetota bacterium]